MEWLKAILSPVAEAYKARTERKAKLEQVKLESEIAAEKAWMEWRIKNIDADAAWEVEQIRNSGWKDEWVLVVLTIPMVFVFIPWTAPFVLEGFQVLDQTPEWYRWLLVMIYAATYGIRVWRREAS